MTTLTQERPCVRCGAEEGVWFLADDGMVCQSCIGRVTTPADGYRLCDHGYLLVCYRCGRGFDERGRKVGHD